ncbi:MAG: hypothetical protein ACI4SG_06090 [Oligosphaeraceae bacterium]
MSKSAILRAGSMAMVFLLLALGTWGCGRKKFSKPQPISAWENVQEPSVVLMREKPNGYYGTLSVVPLSRLVLSDPRRVLHEEELHARSGRVSVALFRREADPSLPGNLLLEMRVFSNGRVYEPAPLSWNGREDRVICSGRGWLVALKGHGEGFP